MSITLNEEQTEFLHNTIELARQLLDNVHCYETKAFDDLGIASYVLDGFDLKAAESLYKDG